MASAVAESVEVLQPTLPRHDVDTRHKAGHDADGVGRTPSLCAYARKRG